MLTHRFIAMFFLLSCIHVKAELRLASLFTDNMVLQRDTPILIWGWATVGEEIEVTFNNEIVRCIAQSDNRWEANFSSLGYGGSYHLLATTKNDSIGIKNITMGDVWVCSGQSNMQFPLLLSHQGKEYILQSSFPSIRLLTIPKDFSNKPQNDFDSRWEVCNPLSVLSFSAIGFYFARELYENLNVPIGIINVTSGGTDIETWISSDTFLKLAPEYRYKYNSNLIESIGKQTNVGMEEFIKAMDNDFAIEEKWYKQGDISSWDSINVPSSWEYTPLQYVDGHIWFKTSFNIENKPRTLAGLLSLGSISKPIIWINGLQLAQEEPNDAFNLHMLPAEMLKEGVNEITLRISNYGDLQGVLGSKEDYFIELFGESDSNILVLAGKWKYKVSVNTLGTSFFTSSPNMLYSSIYNSMINPLIQFPIKGVLWYQGENNVNKANDYSTLFPTLITDWRKQWGYEFPFYWVQLTSYNPIDSLPKESKWAELREAQTTTLHLPNTGQAISYDLGSQFNIHPPHKREIAERLASIALSRTYENDIVCCSPILESFQVCDSTIVITMQTFGSELSIRDSDTDIVGFAIAGEDQVFRWATAQIIDRNSIVVYSDQIETPVAVRYGWTDYVIGNVINKEGLPIAPFRTDTWITSPE